MPEISYPYLPPHIVNDTLSPTALRAGARNISESNRPRDGYPGLIPGYPGTRLFMPLEEVLKVTTCEEVWELPDGTYTKIFRVHLPPGHDTKSESRAQFLSSPENVANLIYPPIPDIVTGSNDRVEESAFRRWLASGFRVFDQHDRVMPGSFERVVQLLSMRLEGESGSQLGTVLGNGTFASPGPHPASDPFILMRLPETDDLATLVWGHPPNEQAHEVWVPPGGFGSREDIVNGKYSSWKTAVRLCLAKAGFDISEFPHKKVHEEIAVSSPTTINSVLIPVSHLVIVPYSQEIARHVLHEIPMGDDVTGAKWLSVRSLLKKNTELRHAGAYPDFDHKSQPDHVYWDTHMRGFLKAINTYRQLLGHS